MVTIRKVGSWLAHTAVAAVGVPLLTAAISITGADALGDSSAASNVKYAQHLLTGMHWFPLQTVAALILGFVVSRALKARLGVWTWILPLVALTAALPFLPLVSPYARNLVLTLPEKLSDLFGSGCDVRQRCLDQVVLTLPFYSSVGYSIGAFFGSRHFAAPRANAGRVRETA